MKARQLLRKCNVFHDVRKDLAMAHIHEGGDMACYPIVFTLPQALVTPFRDWLLDRAYAMYPVPMPHQDEAVNYNIVPIHSVPQPFRALYPEYCDIPSRRDADLLRRADAPQEAGGSATDQE